jgi:hypothetical protein
VEPGDPVRWAGDIVFAAVALALVIAARRRIRAAAKQPRSQGSFASVIASPLPSFPQPVTNHTKPWRPALLVTTYRQGTRLQSPLVRDRGLI